MDLQDYLLDTKSLDWTALLADWEEFLPAELEVWFANRFGEPILVFEDGSVHRLDLEYGEVDRLADSRDAFAETIEDATNADAWLRWSEVDRAVEAGLVLEPQQCYGYKTPLVLGGPCTAENMLVESVEAQLAFLADLHRQIRDLPDGTQVRLRLR